MDQTVPLSAVNPSASAPALKVVMRRATDLVPYVKNARTHSDAQIEVLVKSLKEWGWTNPLLIDGQNGIIAGHGRLKAAQKLGMAEVPCIVLDHMTDAQRRAYVLADNQTALLAGWDDELLALELGDLNEMGFDLSSIGFDTKELDELLGENGPTPGLTDPDEIPELPKAIVSRPGDLWLLGRHRLLCGDSSKPDAVSRALAGARAALCLTDPPYGLGDTVSDKNNYSVYEDSQGNLVRLVSEFLPLAKANSDRVVLTPGNGNQKLYPHPTWVMAWFTPAGVGRGPWGFCCWQPILCFGSDPKLAGGNGCHPDAIVHTESSENVGHPCAKPINFWKWVMERTSEPEQVIYEPFCGSGTGIIAAEQTNRTCIAIELDPAYVDVAVQRWERYTGQKATLESGRRTFDAVKAERVEGYNARDDLSKSIDVAYEAVRDRQEVGGPGYVPQDDFSKSNDPFHKAPKRRGRPPKAVAAE